jgi:hypothetical protein
MACGTSLHNHTAVASRLQDLVTVFLPATPVPRRCCMSVSGAASGLHGQPVSDNRFFGGVLLPHRALLGLQRCPCPLWAGTPGQRVVHFSRHTSSSDTSDVLSTGRATTSLHSGWGYPTVRVHHLRTPSTWKEPMHGDVRGGSHGGFEWRGHFEIWRSLDSIVGEHRSCFRLSDTTTTPTICMRSTKHARLSSLWLRCVNGCRLPQYPGDSGSPGKRL